MVDGRPARPAAAERTVQIDNDCVRVSHWRLAPDAATGRHRHELAFVEIELKHGGSG
jgi:beta-alanine degradation protein BauB